VREVNNNRGYELKQKVIQQRWHYRIKVHRRGKKNICLHVMKRQRIYPWTVTGYHQGNQKSIKSKIFCLFKKAYEMSTHQVSCYTMRESQVIRLKKSKYIIRSKFTIGSNFSCSTVFSLFIDVLFELQQLILTCFCKFCCNSVIIMCVLWFLTWFCFAHYWTIEYYVG